MATTALIVAIVGTVASAAGTYISAQNQADMAEYNAKVAEQGAQAAQDQANYEATMHRERVRKILSTQRALYGDSGLDMSGSPLLVMSDTAAQGKMDEEAIRYGGDIKSAQYRSQANLDRMQASGLRTAGTIQAGGTLLSGASSAYGNYGTQNYLRLRGN